MQNLFSTIDYLFWGCGDECEEGCKCGIAGAGEWAHGSFSLILNGETFDTQLCVSEFIKSAQADGCYEMLSCDCGGRGHPVGGAVVASDEVAGTLTWQLTEAFGKPLPPENEMPDWQLKQNRAWGISEENGNKITFSLLSYLILAEKLLQFMISTEQSRLQWPLGEYDSMEQRSASILRLNKSLKSVRSRMSRVTV